MWFSSHGDASKGIEAAVEVTVRPVLCYRNSRHLVYSQYLCFHQILRFVRLKHSVGGRFSIWSRMLVAAVEPV